jgi:hypothetical protein
MLEVAHMEKSKKERSLDVCVGVNEGRRRILKIIESDSAGIMFFTIAPEYSFPLTTSSSDIFVGEMTAVKQTKISFHRSDNEDFDVLTMEALRTSGQRHFRCGGISSARKSKRGFAFVVARMVADPSIDRYRVSLRRENLLLDSFDTTKSTLFYAVFTSHSGRVFDLKCKPSHVSYVNIVFDDIAVHLFYCYLTVPSYSKGISTYFPAFDAYKKILDREINIEDIVENFNWPDGRDPIAEAAFIEFLKNDMNERNAFDVFTSRLAELSASLFNGIYRETGYKIDLGATYTLGRGDIDFQRTFIQLDKLNKKSGMDIHPKSL